jgi:hypothetical protein
MLTPNQKFWLQSYGDRTIDDVFTIDEMPFILLWSGKMKRYVERGIPSDNVIKTKKSKHGVRAWV